MLTIRRFIVIGWIVSAPAVMAQEPSADGIAPEEVSERAIENAGDSIDRQLSEEIIEHCAAIITYERLASMLRQLLEDARRNQAEPYRDVSSVEEALAQLERGLESLRGRRDCDVPAVASLLPRASLLAQQSPEADDALLLEELVQERDGPYPIGVPFPEEALTCRYYQNAIADQIVNDANGDPIILLTSVVTSDYHGKRFPNIVHMADAGYWVRTPIPRTGNGWTHVHVSRDLQHILLLMDHTVESADWETSAVVSTDRGRSWRYGGRFRKYVYFDVISYFSMSETGSGTAVEHYVGDVGGYEDIGYYIFEANDWGLKWSDRVYQKEFDPSGYVDVTPGRLQRSAAETPLRQVSLLGFDQCSSH